MGANERRRQASSREGNSTYSPVYNLQPSSLSRPLVREEKAGGSSKNETKKPSSVQQPSLQYKTEKYANSKPNDRFEDTKQTTPIKTQHMRPDLNSLTKNETVTFEVSNQPLDLTYSKSEQTVPHYASLPLTKDLLSKECSNLSLTLGQTSFQESRPKAGLDKGDEMTEVLLHKRLDLANPTTNLKKIIAREGNRRSQSNDPSIVNLTQPSAAKNSKESVPSKQKNKSSIESKESSALSQVLLGQRGVLEGSNAASVHSRSSQRLELAEKSQKSGKDSSNKGGSLSQRQGQTAAITFGKRDNLSSLMNGQYINPQTTSKTQTSSTKGESSLRNLHSGNSIFQRNLNEGQPGMSNAIETGEEGRKQTSSKITPQVIYQKLGRTPELDFRKRSSPVKAFEAKAETKPSGKAIGSTAEQDYLNLNHHGENSFVKAINHKYAKSGYKGLTSSTDRPTAVSSKGEQFADSQAHRTLSSHSNRGKEQMQASSTSNIEAGSSILNSHHQADRQRYSRADVNQNLFQFGGNMYSQKNSRYPMPDSRYQKSSSLFSSRDSPGRVSAKEAPEEGSPFTTRQMIKSLLRDELSKVGQA